MRVQGSSCLVELARPDRNADVRRERYDPGCYLAAVLHFEPESIGICLRDPVEMYWSESLQGARKASLWMNVTTRSTARRITSAPFSAVPLVASPSTPVSVWAR